ncbi:hypothetical protein F5Y19DRAFT_292328 [Xylariaceae sp. FL1651]|nr:hypothetical protein F5Y19DRAFT_292328 [Xylariaceae sp. FL1651]
MLSGQSALTSGNRGGLRQSQVAVIRDHQVIPLTRILGESDILLLLTPVVTPPEQNGSDPFEPFGRALAARHPWVRHVPYTARNGITSTHVGFIKRARAVVFVISGPPASGQPSQAEIAQVSQSIGDEKPHIIVACGNIQDLGLAEASFPAIIQASGYLPQDLRAAAAVLFGEAGGTGTSGVKVQELIMAPKYWPPEEWDGLDVSPIYDLWNQCLPDQFHLERFPLQNLLQRDGYAMHFVVRLPETREIIGFCATYTTFVDKGEERLIGSLAMIIVKSPYRGRGVGLSLYNHAVRQLKRLRGVDRIQLGSTYPRLLSGIPAGFSSEEWFQRRGWSMDKNGPGRGQYVCDWLLKIEDWPNGGFLAGPAELAFRSGTFDDSQPVLDFIEKETTRKDHTGWYDQYMNLVQDGRVNDVILGFERSRIIAAALIYTPHEGSPLALDLPWARRIGPDVGGVTCICIADDNGAMTSSKDTVMIRLLDTCIAALRDQGMQRVYLDAIKGGDEGFQSMGFQKWATYSEIWQQT